MAVELTIFNSIFDNKTHRRMAFESFNELENLLYGLSKKPGYKPKKGEFAKNASPLITPAVFHAETTRANKNVIGWGGWAAIDVDEYPIGGFEDAIRVFNRFRYVCYSSASSKKEHPKFRMVLPLTEWIPSDRIRHFWYALNKEFCSLADPQTKDLSRMYYVPAQYPNAYNFIFSKRDAEILNPNALMEKHPWVNNQTGTFMDKLPEAIQKKLEEYQKSKLSNAGKFKWTSYRDCPFIRSDLIQKYRSITGTGWYSLMFKIMVSTAASAVRKGYPISPHEIARLCRELDQDTGSWYKNRPMEAEAARAVSYALRSVI